MSPSTPKQSSSTKLAAWVGQVLLLAFVYVLVGRFGLGLADYQGNVTFIWAPTGVALGALILFGRRLWPGVFIGAALVNVSSLSDLTTVSLGIGIGNTLEALIGATLLQRVDFRPDIARGRDVGSFLLIGVLGCTLLSATIGSTTLWVTGNLDANSFQTVWLIWWLGDAGGALVVTPLLMMWIHGTPAWNSLLRSREFWIMLAILLATNALTFWTSIPGVLGVLLLLPAFPILVWAGTTLGSRSVMLVSFLIVWCAALATIRGAGPFATGTPTAQTALLWAYSMLIGFTALTLAVVAEQRDFATRRHKAEELERRRADRESLLLLERERITREMHDGLGGQLVSLLSVVERGVGTRAEIAEGLRRALDDIRIVIDALDPNTTDLPTALGKLRSRLEPLLRRNGIELAWKVDKDARLRHFDPDEVLHLLRIIQEGVTNTMRHAGANRVEVEVTATDAAELRLAIRDDGRGFSQTSKPSGRGIQSMHSRAQELGARLRIEAADGGTLIDLCLSIPLHGHVS